jgi:hypothetical protein
MMLDHTREQYDLAASIGDVLNDLAHLASTCSIVGFVLALAAVFSGVK